MHAISRALRTMQLPCLEETQNYAFQVTPIIYMPLPSKIT